VILLQHYEPWNFGFVRLYIGGHPKKVKKHRRLHVSQHSLDHVSQLTSTAFSFLGAIGSLFFSQ